MALTSGTRLGVYWIADLIGVGGMGEVYRARDTKLNRDVALKVLPELFAADPDRLARFKREAQVLASLNHPNIAAIYGIEESPSADSGTAAVYALVLELVEGPTLAERIAQGTKSKSQGPKAKSHGPTPRVESRVSVSPLTRRCRSRARLPMRSMRRTSAASSTVISSQRTSKCARTARSRCSTSASPRPSM